MKEKLDMGPSAIGAGRPYSAALEYEPNSSTEDPEELACRADDVEAGGASETTGEGGSETVLGTDNNAARTRERQSSGAYADAGFTRTGDGVFAGVAALKTRVAESGAEVEAFSASAQLGAQNELQAGMARIGGSVEGKGLSASVTVDVLTTRANGGIYNDDDSVGANLGATTTFAGIELTAGSRGWQATVGVAASLGVAVSSGDRNTDGDATIERCFKGSIGPLTLGFCSEL
jgi:hypothetical protein